MGKNRVQKKERGRSKPSKDNIYSKKHVRITLMKQEKMKQIKTKQEKMKQTKPMKQIKTKQIKAG
jgi:hypothetical protein